MNKVVKRILLLISLPIALLIALALISNLFCKAASFDERRLGYYENEPKNSMDVVFIGASEIYTGWAPALAYEEYGITSYPYCISAAPVRLWKTMVQEALKKQSPECVVVDPYGAALYDDAGKMGLYNPAPKYQLLNMVPFSPEKIKMVDELCADMSTMDKLSYLLPFVKHHDTYVDFPQNFKSSREIISGKTSPIKGMRTLTELYNPGVELLPTDDKLTSQIVPAAEEALKDFLEYCRQNNIKVLFVHFPAVVVEGSEYCQIDQKCNYAGAIARSYGYDYINLQDHVREMGILSSEDFYQPGHLNVRGQRKATVYLGRILSDQYLKKVNHSDKKLQNEWKEAYNIYENYYKYACDCIDRGQAEELQDGPETMAKLQ